MSPPWVPILSNASGSESEGSKKNVAPYGSTKLNTSDPLQLMFFFKVEMEGDQEQSGKDDGPDVPLQSGKGEEIQQLGKGLNNSQGDERVEPLQDGVVEDKVRHLLFYCNEHK